MIQLRVSFPTGDGHGFDESGLTCGARLKLIDQGVHQFVEEGGAFRFQHDAARELVVAAGVLRRSLLAFFGDGSGGPFCVGAVGLDLTFCCHSFG
jgi:hypothetical protein